MRTKVIFIIAAVGIALALVTAYMQGREKKALPPAFTPASNPYGKGIYANGIIESYQESGEKDSPDTGGVLHRRRAGAGRSLTF